MNMLFKEIKKETEIHKIFSEEERFGYSCLSRYKDESLEILKDEPHLTVHLIKITDNHYALNLKNDLTGKSLTIVQLHFFKTDLNRIKKYEFYAMAEDLVESSADVKIDWNCVSDTTNKYHHRIQKTISSNMKYNDFEEFLDYQPLKTRLQKIMQ